MARARNIKPGFFMNEVLAEMPATTRLLFIGLWTVADREGRLEDRPKRIRMQVLPYDMSADVEAMLEELESGGFLIRYSVDGSRYCQIENFTKHQTPHHKEVASVIPPPPGCPAVTRHAYDVSKELRQAIFDRDGRACLKCGDTSALTIDHAIPLSRGGDNSPENLQTLCHSCNASKGDAAKSYIDSTNFEELGRRSFHVGATKNQRKTNDDASCPSDSLIPDSLIPDSLPLARKRAEPKQSAKKPDLLFEAIAAACGIDWKALTKNERGALNNATAQLRAINATPEDVQARAGRYRQKWPGIDLTAMALVNNWNTVIAAPEKAACQIPQMKSPPHMKQGDYESLDRHGKLSAWDEWGEMWQRRKAAGDVAQAQGEN